jgi:hypothetical protein
MSRAIWLALLALAFVLTPFERNVRNGAIEGTALAEPLTLPDCDWYFGHFRSEPEIVLTDFSHRLDLTWDFSAKPILDSSGHWTGSWQPWLKGWRTCDNPWRLTDCRGVRCAIGRTGLCAACTFPGSGAVLVARRGCMKYQCVGRRKHSP